MWGPFNWRNLVDFLVLCFAFYLLLQWAARARALRIALTITALYAGSLAARRLELVITGWVLQGAAIIATALLVVIFQPEVRRALMGLDRRFLALTRRPGESASANRTLAQAAFALASQRIGALFAIPRQDALNELMDGGVEMMADVSPGLIDSIFQKTSPLHDGAVLIENGRIARADAVLPLTQRADVPSQFGTRHRAAMGLAERSDAVVIAVSEERGEVSVMRGRTVLRVRSVDELCSLLDHSTVRAPRTAGARLRSFLTSNWRFKLAAVGIASMIWTVATLESSASVRTISVPVEFQNVPRGLDIASQSATELVIQLRGRTWMLDTMNLPRLVARFDLTKATEGVEILRVEPGVLTLPPGVIMMRVTPTAITLRLVKRGAPKPAAGL